MQINMPIRKQKRNSLFQTHLVVDPRCEKLIRDFERVVFKSSTRIPTTDLRSFRCRGLLRRARI